MSGGREQEQIFFPNSWIHIVTNIKFFAALRSYLQLSVNYPIQTNIGDDYAAETKADSKRTSCNYCYIYLSTQYQNGSHVGAPRNWMLSSTLILIIFFTIFRNWKDPNGSSSSSSHHQLKACIFHTAINRISIQPSVRTRFSTFSMWNISLFFVLPYHSSSTHIGSRWFFIVVWTAVYSHVAT